MEKEREREGKTTESHRCTVMLKSQQSGSSWCCTVCRLMAFSVKYTFTSSSLSQDKDEEKPNKTKNETPRHGDVNQPTPVSKSESWPFDLFTSHGEEMPPPPTICGVFNTFSFLQKFQTINYKEINTSKKCLRSTELAPKTSYVFLIDVRLTIDSKPRLAQPNQLKRQLKSY